MAQRIPQLRHHPGLAQLSKTLFPVAAHLWPALPNVAGAARHGGVLLVRPDGVDALETLAGHRPIERIGGLLHLVANAVPRATHASILHPRLRPAYGSRPHSFSYA